METSESLAELALSLSKFQGEVKAISKDGLNPYFKSKYATLENVISTIKPVLEKNGLAFSQFPTGENELATILMHSSGQWIKATAKMTPKDSSPQSQGSAITYLRRYALSAILVVATEDDDDGNSASQTNKTAPRTTKQGKITKDTSKEPNKAYIKELLAELGSIPSTEGEALLDIKRITGSPWLPGENDAEIIKILKEKITVPPPFN